MKLRHYLAEMIPFVVILGILAYHASLFYNNCNQHLLKAVDANSVEIALKELRLAIAYVEEHKMTTGSTGVFSSDKDTDVGFLYENLKATEQVLNTNITIKERRELLRNVYWTAPHGISLFPHNFSLQWALILSGLMAFIGLVGIFRM